MTSFAGMTIFRGRQSELNPCRLGNLGFEGGKQGFEFLVGILHILNLAAGVHNGSVVSTAEMAANLLETVPCQTAG